MAANYTLPVANQAEWTASTDVGVEGGLDQYLPGGANERTNIIDMTASPYFCDNTGVTNVSTIVKTAISNQNDSAVLYFPAGTYLFTNGFIYSEYKNDITIRGAGQDNTTFDLDWDGNNGIFVFNDPGSNGSAAQTITGGKEAGSTNLVVADSSDYSAGSLARIEYENEVNTNRITNGAAPTWSSRGYPWSRRHTVLVTGVPTSTNITIHPPLRNVNGTNLAMRITRSAFPQFRNERIGFEDFKITSTATNWPGFFLIMNDAINCWMYNIKVENWDRNTSSGSFMKMAGSYRVEIRHCDIDATENSSSDGAIQTGGSSCTLIVDNSITGGWGTGIYDNGNAYQSVIAYNYRDQGRASIFHNAHPSHNLLEGNVGPYHQSDGYHGSSSESTLLRNWYWSFGAALNRFKRNYVILGNVVGEDGVTDAVYSFGNPNIGNGAANGFAGPTGLSDQAGETDYSQPGYGYNEYVISTNDIFQGDYWSDWEMTGTLTTRSNDTSGVFSVSGGSWQVGTVTTASARLYPSAWWNSKANSIHNGEVVSVDGSNVGISWPSGTLPAEGTEVQLYMFAAGWQERDLDVQASSTLVHNYESLAAGTGAVANSTTDTLPDSYVYESKPSWFGNLSWPPIDPDNPTFDETVIPAGYRAINGNENYLTGWPANPDVPPNRLWIGVQ